MSAKATRKNPYPNIRNINNVILEAFKTSNIPILQELAKIPNFLKEYMTNYEYYTTLLGSCYTQFYSIIAGSIAEEAAVMAKDALSAGKSMYPGAWSHYLLTTMVAKLLGFAVSPIDDPKASQYMVVDTIAAEEHRKKLKDGGIDPSQYFTLEYVKNLNEHEAMKFEDYTDEKFTNVLVSLATSVAYRCMLLSVDNAPALITTADSPSQPIRLAQLFTRLIVPKIESWCTETYETLPDDTRAEVESFSQNCLDDIMSFICTLAMQGGVNTFLIDAVLAGSTITPMCQYDKYPNGITDPAIEVIYILNYKYSGDTSPVTASIKLSLAKIFSMVENFAPVKSTATMRRECGRMFREAMLGYIRYCAVVLATDPEVMTRYINSLQKESAVDETAPASPNPDIEIDEAETDTSPDDEEPADSGDHKVISLEDYIHPVDSVKRE